PSATLLFCITPPPPSSTLFPYTTLFRSSSDARSMHCQDHRKRLLSPYVFFRSALLLPGIRNNESYQKVHLSPLFLSGQLQLLLRDRKSTRLNSSHVSISYAVFCLKKKKT